MALYSQVQVHRTFGPATERFWLVTDLKGPRGDYCVDQAITTAIYSGSVGATFEYGGDGIEESAGTVVELIERKAGT